MPRLIRGLGIVVLAVLGGSWLGSALARALHLAGSPAELVFQLAGCFALGTLLMKRWSGLGLLVHRIICRDCAISYTLRFFQLPSDHSHIDVYLGQRCLGWYCRDCARLRGLMCTCGGRLSGYTGFGRGLTPRM